MIRKDVHKARWRAALTWACLTFGVGAVAATQAPIGAEGWRIPDGAEAEQNPVPFDPAVLARGQALYRSKCRRCHGVDGKRAGPDADAKNAPADLTDARRASLNPDGVMFYKIWNGRTKPTMPAMKTDMARLDVWTVIHYVKTLRRPDDSTSSK